MVHGTLEHLEHRETSQQRPGPSILENEHHFPGESKTSHWLASLWKTCLELELGFMINWHTNLHLSLSLSSPFSFLLPPSLSLFTSISVPLFLSLYLPLLFTSFTLSLPPFSSFSLFPSFIHTWSGYSGGGKDN